MPRLGLPVFGHVTNTQEFWPTPVFRFEIQGAMVCGLERCIRPTGTTELLWQKPFRGPRGHLTHQEAKTFRLARIVRGPKRIARSKTRRPLL